MIIKRPQKRPILEWDYILSLKMIFLILYFEMDCKCYKKLKAANQVTFFKVWGCQMILLETSREASKNYPKKKSSITKLDAPFNWMNNNRMPLSFVHRTQLPYIPLSLQHFSSFLNSCVL